MEVYVEQPKLGAVIYILLKFNKRAAAYFPVACFAYRCLLLNAQLITLIAINTLN